MLIITFLLHSSSSYPVLPLMCQYPMLPPRRDRGSVCQGSRPVRPAVFVKEAGPPWGIFQGIPHARPGTSSCIGNHRDSVLD